MSISERQAVTITRIEIALLEAERFLSSRQLVAAIRSANAAALGHRGLHKLIKIRRGNPRKELQRKALYYGIWQRAVAGALELAKGHPVGARLLNKAQEDADKLVKMYPDSPEYQELLQKITGWNQR